MIAVSDRDRRSAEKASDLFKALAHPSRILLLCLLSERPRTVGELRDLLGASQADVSQHLIRLRYAGFVTSERDGRYALYKLSDPAPLCLIDALAPQSLFVSAKEPGSSGQMAPPQAADARRRGLLAP